MAEFYMESQFLDLKKKYQDFKYTPLWETITDKEIEIESNVSANKFLLVQEQDQLLSDIKNLCIYFQNVHIQKQKKFDFPFQILKNRVCQIIQQYQEQPNLLDSLLEKIITPIMHLIKLYINQYMIENFQICNEFHVLIQIIYILCKVRGYKAIIEYFPHEVKDLEPVIHYLIAQKQIDVALWENKYILLLWLSIIILVPFDLITIDSEKQICDEKGTIFELLLNISKFYLKSSSITKEAAAIFLSKFFQRPDIQKQGFMKEYLIWSKQIIQNKNNDPLYNFFISGIYNSLVEILKVGQRNELLVNIEQFVDFIIFNEKDQCVDRLYKVKLASRVGMTYLKPRLVTWAYKKSVKSLTQNVQKSQNSKLQINCGEYSYQKKNENINDQFKQQINQNDEDYFKDVNLENLETVIEFLLQNLSDKDTVVRWSAAKGLGRITSRLDLDMADDVVNSLFQVLNFDRNEASWHGCCLTLAELSRRGLLLPSRLNQAFSYLKKALLYDENKGSFSSGANVRDAACYVAWAFARAYDSEILKDYVLDLAKNLLVVSLYDREVNCRRAASAAFQEHVGRQGTFPHGIDILTEADYFTLGIRTHAYLNVGLYVSSFQIYQTTFIQHLQEKLGHQDINIRTLSSAALGIMVPLNPEYFVINVIPDLIKGTLSEMVNKRHGCFYALGDIILGLCGKSDFHNLNKMNIESILVRFLSKNDKKLHRAGEYRQKFNEKYDYLKQQNNQKILTEDIKKQIIETVGQLKQNKMFRGKSGEIMRICICRFIECISLVEFPIYGNYDNYLEILEDCFKSNQDQFQESARKAMVCFSNVYQGDLNENLQNWVSSTIKQCDLSVNSNEIVVRGLTKCISSLSVSLKKKFLNQLLALFDKNTNLNLKKIDAETRKFSIQGIQELVNQIDLKEFSIQQFQQIFQILFKSFKDYTLDNRGDIGSIVREQSMITVVEIIKKTFKENREFLNEGLIIQVIQNLLQQLVEKIDRIRLIAGSCLQELYNQILKELEFTNKDIISQIFDQQNLNSLIEINQQKMDKEFQVPTVTQLINDVASDQQMNADLIYPWNIPSCIFPTIVPLLNEQNFTYNILKGLCVSVGGITCSTSNVSQESLIQVVKKYNKQEQFENLFVNLYKILVDNFQNDRIVIPLLKTIEDLFENIDFQQYQNTEKFSILLFKQIELELKKSKSIMKIYQSCGILSSILCFTTDEKNNILNQICLLLVHKYPKVRKQMADKFYLFLLNFGELIYEEHISEQLQDAMLENDWLEASEEALKELKTQLQDLIIQ